MGVLVPGITLSNIFTGVLKKHNDESKYFLWYFHEHMNQNMLISQ